MMIVRWEFIIPPDWQTWVELISTGCVGFLAQTALNNGGQMIDATKTSVLRCMDIFFTLIWQITLLSDIPTLWSLLGMGLIVGSTIFAVLAKNTNVQKPPQLDEPLDTELESNNTESPDVIEVELETIEPALEPPEISQIDNSQLIAEQSTE
jgi:hypothetical protein